MSRYQQSSKLRSVRYDVRGPNLVEAQRMEAAGEDIIKLNIGNLAPFGFRAPEAIVKSVVAHLGDSQGYSDSRGIYEARTAVANYYQGFGMDVDVDQVLIGNGVSELISLVLQAMLDDGDEVLVPAPDYPLWTGEVSLCGAKAVHYLCDESNGWNPDLDDIRSKVTDRTRAIVVINPNNPTGAVYSRDIVQGMIDIAREHDLIMFSDEIYEKIIFDDAEHIHTAELAGDDVLCFTFCGLSKAYRLCGYRSGWMVWTGPIAEAQSLLEGLTLLSNMRMCANVPAQHAIQTALGGHQSIESLVAPGGRFYEQLKLAHELLVEIPGVSCEPARGALYLFPRLDPQVYPIQNDEAWALELLQRKKILVSHGMGFNWPHPDHFRLVALPDTEMLTEAVGRIAEFLEESRA